MPSELDWENARLVLPYLVDYAQKRETITYGGLAAKAGKHHRRMPNALGVIRDEICIPRKLPLINAIVIKQDTGQPGHSFLPEGTGHLNVDEYRQAYQLLRDEVFAYQGWYQVLEALSLLPVEKSPEDFNKEGREYLSYEARQGGVGEGDDHRRLKLFIARHPEILGLPEQRAGDTEVELLSGDRCDVVFWMPNSVAVAEIKNGERGELVKGIFQTVKYRAILEAQKGQGAPYPVTAFLVAYNIPNDIAAFAARFGIECREVTSSQIME